MSVDVAKLPELIRDKKRRARSQIGDVDKLLNEIETNFAAEVDDIASRRARGDSIVPEIDFSQIRDGKVSDETKALIRRRGTAVVRNVFPRAQAEAWNRQIGDYLTRNDYLNKAATRD